MTTVNVYLNFLGNCEEAFSFYKSVFGGEFGFVGKFKDMPPQEGAPAMGPEEGEKIMHISLPISKETVLMGSDTGGEWAPTFQLGTNYTISINTDTKAEADRLFKGLSVGGKVTMPMADVFWGDYFGFFVDKYGINWMVSFNEEQSKKE